MSKLTFDSGRVTKYMHSDNIEKFIARDGAFVLTEMTGKYDMGSRFRITCCCAKPPGVWLPSKTFLGEYLCPECHLGPSKKLEDLCDMLNLGSNDGY